MVDNSGEWNQASFLYALLYVLMNCLYFYNGSIAFSKLTINVLKCYQWLTLSRGIADDFYIFFLIWTSWEKNVHALKEHWLHCCHFSYRKCSKCTKLQLSVLLEVGKTFFTSLIIGTSEEPPQTRNNGVWSHCTVPGEAVWLRLHQAG